MEDSEPDAEEIHLQLLQMNEFDHTDVTQCKIKIDRTISYCGIHSHVSLAENGRPEYIRKVNTNTCKKLHDTGTIFVGNNALITSVKVNAISRHSLTFTEVTGVNGYCEYNLVSHMERGTTWSYKPSSKLRFGNFKPRSNIQKTKSSCHPAQYRASAGECLDDETSTH